MSHPWTKSKSNKLGYTQASREGAYSRARWIHLRNYMLDINPLCISCQTTGRVVPGAIVDHIQSINGENDPLFYEISNLQVLCEPCHRQKTRKDNSKYSKDNRDKGAQLMRDLES